MAHGAYAVAMLSILCVALIVCVALMSAIDNCDIMFASCLLYTSPSPRDRTRSRMPSSA